MSVIDSRIVEMKFDNKQFESGVHETLGTLEKLKSALKLDNAIEGFSSLAKAASKVDFGSLASNVETIASRFTTFGIIGTEVLERIGQKVADVGQKLVGFGKSLTIDQMSAGWSKYEQKTTAVQTIMAATANQFTDAGEQMEYVNTQLDKLNWFTDETSYNFVDMVGNIGKFTSNGIALESAVTSMQGIANWAAISGQNASTASRAMYNLAQAIGVGSVKLIDWRSIENANMATQAFKEQVIQTAVAQGKLQDKGNGTYKVLTEDATATTKKTKEAKEALVSLADFNSELSKGWFDRDVLTAVLNKYGEATNKLFELSEASGTSATDILQFVEASQKGKLSTSAMADAIKDSGMTVEEYKTKIEELASTDYEFGINAFKAAQEAKTFSDAIDATKDAVSTGWMNTWETIFGDYETARHTWTDMANNLWEIFASGGERRNSILEEWSRTGYDEVVSTIKKAGFSVNEFEKSLYSSLEATGVPVKELVEEFGSLDEAIRSGEIDGDLLGRTIKAMLQATTNLSEDQLELFNNLIEDEKIMNNLAGESGRQMFLNSINNTLVNIADTMSVIKDSFAMVFGEMNSSKLIAFSAGLEKITEKLAIYEELDNGDIKFTDLGQTLSDIFTVLGMNIESFLGIFDALKSKVLDLFQVISSRLPNVLSIWYKLSSFIQTINKGIADAINRRDTTYMFESWGTALDNILGPVNKFFEILNARAIPIIKHISDDLLILTNRIANVLDNIFGIFSFNNLNTRISLFDYLIGNQNESEWVEKNLNKIFDLVFNLKNVLSSVGTILQDTFNIVIDFLKPVAAFLSNFNILDIINSGLEILNKILLSIAKTFDGIIEDLSNSDLIIKLINKFKDTGKYISDIFNKLKGSEKITNIISNLTNTFSKLWNIVSKLFTSISGMLSKINYGRIFETIGEILSNITGYVSNLFDDISKAGIFDWIGDKVANAVNVISNFFAKFKSGKGDLDSATESVSAFAKVWEWLKFVLDNVWNKIKGFFSNFGEKLGKLKDTVFNFIKQLFDSFDISELSFLDIFKTGSLGKVISGFIKDLNKALNVKKRGSFFENIGDFFSNLNDGFENFRKILKNLKSGKTNLSEILGLDKIFGDGGPLGKFKDLFGGGSSSVLEKIGKMLKDIGSGLLMIAAALLIISLVDPMKMVTSLLVMVDSLASILTLFTAFLALTKSLGIDDKNIIAASAAIGILSVSLILLAVALGAFALITNMDTIIEGLATLGIALTFVCGALLLLSNFADPGSLIAAAGAIFIVSAALIVLAGALALFALLSNFDSSVSGLLLMLDALLAVTVPLLALSIIGPSILAGAGAILIVAAALIVLAAALGAFTLVATLFSGCAAGLLAMVGVLAAITAALLALSIIGPSVLVAAGAITIVAAALLVAAAAFAVFALAITPLAAGLTAVGVAISAIILGILGSIAGGITLIVNSLSNGIVSISDGLLEGSLKLRLAGETLAEGVYDILSTIGSAIGEIFRQIGDGIGDGFTNIGKGIANGIGFIGTAIEGFSSNISTLKSGIEDVGIGIENFGNNIRSLDGIKWTDVGSGMISVANGLKQLNKQKFSGKFQDIVDYTNALKELSEMGTYITDAAEKIVNEIERLGKRISETLANGINSASSYVYNAAVNLSVRAINGADVYTSSFYTVGSNMGIGLANGLYGSANEVQKAATYVSDIAAKSSKKQAEEKSPSRVFMQIGKYMSEGMAIGIRDGASDVTDASSKVTGYVINSAKTIADAISTAMAMEDSGLVLTPVLDLSEIQNGARSINSIFSNNSALNLGSSISGDISSSKLASEVKQAIVASLDPNSLNAINQGMTIKNETHVTFEGSLAQLASILKPVIENEIKRVGPSYIND